MKYIPYVGLAVLFVIFFGLSMFSLSKHDDFNAIWFLILALSIKLDIVIIQSIFKKID